MARGPSQGRALQGLRVLELGDEKGVYCGKLLADLGATVIRLERPGGDPIRRQGPFKDDLPHPEMSLSFAYYHTNKKSVTLAVHHPAGRRLFLGLVTRVDVLIESWEPGALAVLGLGYGQLQGLNPRLIMVSITPFGQSGPRRAYRGDNFVAMAMGGLMHISGNPDAPPTLAPGQQACDLGGVHGALGAMAALRVREATGEGQHVDISLQECLAAEEHNISRYSFDGHIIGREGSQHGVVAPGRVYPCQDGHVHIYVGGGGADRAETWQSFLEWMGTPPFLADPIWADGGFRRANTDILDPVVAAFTRQHPRERLVHEGQERHLPVAPINTPAAFTQDEQMQARGFFVEVEHPVMGRQRMVGPSYHLSETPWHLASPAPLVGQHNEEVFCGLLGLSRQELVILHVNGVI